VDVGDKVLIRGGHVWAGNRGRCVRFDTTPFGVRPVIRLERRDAMDGHEVFLVRTTDAIILQEDPNETITVDGSARSVFSRRL